MTKGKLVSFIGMDGAGKTTLSSALKEKLDRIGFKSRIIYAGRGQYNILPIQFLGKIYMKGMEKKGKARYTEKTSIIRCLSAPVFAFDLLLRYFFVIVPALGKNDFVITDRYSTDILLMKNVPYWLKRFLYFFLPTPGTIIYVYNTIPVLHTRKPMHPVEDLKRQEKIFNKLLKKINPEKIKNNSINESLDKIMKIILKNGC